MNINKNYSSSIKKVNRAKQRVGGFSDTTKMPGFSFSLPAEACKTGSKLHTNKNSICGSCYARKGFYNMPNVKAALGKRLDILNKAMKTKKGREEWIESFVEALTLLQALSLDPHNHITDRDDNFFRWHDSGDLQSIVHLRMIIEVAARAPQINFVIPTKEIHLVQNYISEGNSLPRNLTIRLSLHKKGLAPKKFKELAESNKQINLAASHVNTPEIGFLKCPADKGEYKCGDCRNCWNPSLKISFKEH